MANKQRGIKYYLEDLKKLSKVHKVILLLIALLVTLGVGSFVFTSNANDDQGKTPFFGIEFDFKF